MVGFVEHARSLTSRPHSCLGGSPLGSIARQAPRVSSWWRYCSDTGCCVLRRFTLGEFIPLVEETGLILPLGRWLLHEACRQAKSWEGQCGEDSPLVVSVNLSVRQFRHPDLADEVAQELKATGPDPGRLQLEVTESVAMEDGKSPVGMLSKLKDLGAHLAIDDIGTGYSSLNYLKRFPVDVLKINRSFVDGLGGDPEDEAIVGAIVTLAHTLGMQVTGEGIETLDQLQRLRLLGCERAQGYYFSRPLPAEAAGALLTGDTSTLEQGSTGVGETRSSLEFTTSARLTDTCIRHALHAYPASLHRRLPPASQDPCRDEFKSHPLSLTAIPG